MWGMWRRTWYTGGPLLNADPNNFLTLQILATKDSKNALFADNCTPLGYYAASSGNFLATFGPIYLLPNNPGECISHLLRCGSLKSHSSICWQQERS